MIRILIVGSPRSGTTLMQRVLSEHPALTSFPETRLMDALVGSSRWRRRMGIVDAAAGRERMTAFLREAGFESDPVGDRVRGLRSLRLSRWLTEVSALFDDIARARGASGWIEKTPRHLQYLEAILARLPSLKVVHVLRPGVDAVASVVDVSRRHPEAWGSARTVEEAARRWLLDVSLHRRWIEDPRHTSVHHADLVADPEQVFRRVILRLGLDPEVDAAAAEDGASTPLIAEGEAWKEAALGPISAAATTAAADRLSEDELRRLRELVGDVDIREITGPVSA